MHTLAVSHLNNRLNVPLNLKESLTLKYVFSYKIRPFKLLKSVKGGVGMYLGPPRYCYALNIHLV